MKKRWLALVLLLEFTACSRHNDVGNDCINRYSPDEKANLVPRSQLDTITRFFTFNNLSTSGLQFTYILYDAIYNPSQYSGPQDQIAANLFINGLPVFQPPVYFDFDSSGPFQSPALNSWQGQLPANDTKTRLALETLRQTFSKELQAV